MSSNPVERAIYEMQKLSDLTESFKREFREDYGGQIVTIPFERFVLDPWPYMRRLEELLATKVTSKTRRVMKKQNVPREKISDGIPLDIYKRCGWEPPGKELNGRQEMDKRRQYAVDQGANKEAMDVLDRICLEYKEKYI